VSPAAAGSDRLPGPNAIHEAPCARCGLCASRLAARVMWAVRAVGANRVDVHGISHGAGAFAKARPIPACVDQMHAFDRS
jgi:hypothetical protein